MELERALEAGVSVIVIEPEPLGEETARWIYVGNLLHKVSVYSGLCGIASGKLSKTKNRVGKITKRDAYNFTLRLSVGAYIVTAPKPVNQFYCGI